MSAAIAAARAAVKVDVWEWCTGMRMILNPEAPPEARRVVRYTPAIGEALGLDKPGRVWAPGTEPVPDLDDGTTQGATTAILRRWLGPTVHLRTTEGGWGLARRAPAHPKLLALEGSGEWLAYDGTWCAAGESRRIDETEVALAFAYGLAAAASARRR